MTILEKVQAFEIPFAKLLGIEFVSADPEKIVATMVVRDDLCTTSGVVHGGALMAFADTLGAAATIVNLQGDAGTTTLESKTNFLRPAPGGARLTGTTSAVHRGRRTQVWQTRIEDAEGRAVAMVTQTQLVL